MDRDRDLADYYLAGYDGLVQRARDARRHSRVLVATSRAARALAIEVMNRVTEHRRDRAVSRQRREH